MLSDIEIAQRNGCLRMSIHQYPCGINMSFLATIMDQCEFAHVVLHPGRTEIIIQTVHCRNVPCKRDVTKEMVDLQHHVLLGCQ